MNVITYGTFDTFHFGHIEILRRAKELGGKDAKLIVAVSSDEFNKSKGKTSYHNFQQRKNFVESIRYVDLVIEENSWEQKIDDFKKYDIDLLVMGNDWENSPQFEEIKKKIKYQFLPRTKMISSTQIRNIIDNSHHLS